MKYIVFAFLIFLLGCNTNSSGVDTPPSEELSTAVAYKKMNGVDPNLLSLDIYYNSLTKLKKPVVIWVHGGGWRRGDKENQIENKVNLFQSLDYVFVSINYRLSPYPNEINNPDRVKFPVHEIDVADAIKWVYTNIDKYGGNPDKIALLGHSAGAQLVCLIGTNPTFLENTGLNLTNIKGVAAIDTEGYNVLEQVQDNNQLYINAFGTDANSNIQASPILNIQKGVSYPNFFIAKRGSPKRIAIADDFINALEQDGVSVSQVDGSIYDHGGINNAIGEPGETLITDPLKEFFKNCFE